MVLGKDGIDDAAVNDVRGEERLAIGIDAERGAGEDETKPQHGIPRRTLAQVDHACREPGDRGHDQRDEEHIAAMAEDRLEKLTKRDLTLGEIGIERIGWTHKISRLEEPCTR